MKFKKNNKTNSKRKKISENHKINDEEEADEEEADEEEADEKPLIHEAQYFQNRYKNLRK